MKEQEGERGRDARSAKERKDARWTSKDHPRGEQKRGGAAAKDTVISYRSGTDDAAERREVDPQGERKTRREREVPRVVPGGPRPVENGAAA